MANERKHTGESRVPYPVRGFFGFCKHLYEEGLGYDKLPEEQVKIIGKHTSILLHDYPHRKGRWISLHFREGLESFTEGKMKLGMVRDFRNQIGADLNCLSKKLLGDLGDVDMVYGLSQVSAEWGGNHGFTTKLVTKDPEFIRTHCESITGLPPQTNNQPPLTLFSISRDALIGEYYGNGRSAPKAPVADAVGNIRFNPYSV